MRWNLIVEDDGLVATTLQHEDQSGKWVGPG